MKVNNMHRKLFKLSAVITYCVLVIIVGGCKADGNQEKINKETTKMHLPEEESDTNSQSGMKDKLDEEKTETETDESYQWKLVWSDEFNGEGLDLNKWSYELGNAYNGWGNYEAQYYQKENVYVTDGKLVIEAKREDVDGCQYTSGRIRTVTEDGEVLFSTKYGKIEARISMPAMAGMWPAFWMMPVENKYGQWPLSGEIDIVEARGRIDNEINGTIHYGEALPNNKQSGTKYTLKKDTIKDFHVYAVEWTPDEIKWLIDGEVYGTSSNWYTVDKNEEVLDYPAPFDQSFYLLLNLAVGGTYDEGVMPEEDMVSEKMYVDYVRVYESETGYPEFSEEKKNSEKDLKNYEEIKNVEDFVVDKIFETINTNPYTEEINYESGKWYFVSKALFRGNAKGKITDLEGNKFFYCDVIKAADKRYSIQLLHMLPLVKGYTYAIEFDAKAKSKRAISLQPMGHKGDEVLAFCDRLKIVVDDEMRRYRYSFTIKEDTDMNGFIEINLGAEEPDLYIGNVSIKIIN